MHVRDYHMQGDRRSLMTLALGHAFAQSVHATRAGAGRESVTMKFSVLRIGELFNVPVPRPRSAA